jgi:hypothetical protein
VTDVTVALSFNDQPLPSSQVCPDTHPNLLFRHTDEHGQPVQRERIHYQASNLKITFIPRIGYNTLYPLILQLLDLETDFFKIYGLLDIIENPKMLWTDYGLRSLSAEDIFYWKDNAPGDRPYWR